MDVNSKSSRYSAFLLGTIGVQTFILLPGMVYGYVEVLGLSDEQAGYIASAETFGIAVTAVLSSFTAHKINWRHAMYACLLTAMAGNFLAILFADSISGLFVTRFIAGLGYGGLVSMSFAAVGLTRHKEQNFAWYIIWLLAYSAVGLFILPSILNSVGLYPIFIFFILFCGTGLFTIRFMPESTHSRDESDPYALETDTNTKICALTGVLCYNIAQGIAWTYLFLIGINAGLAEQFVANALTVSQLFGIGGALYAVFIANKFGRLGAIIAGIFGGTLSLIPLLNEFGIVVYCIAVCAFNLFWNMVLPYILSVVSSLDKKGMMTIYAISLQMIGLGVAPAMAAMLIGEPDGYKYIIYLCIAFFIISFILLVSTVIRHNKRLQLITQE